MTFSTFKRAARSLALPTVVALLAGAPAAAAFKYAEEGQKAPDFTLKDLSGQNVALRERVSSAKALALVFWAGWSPRSKPMLDDLNALLKERQDKGLAVLTVNVEHEHPTAEDLKVVGEMAKSWSFPVLIDDGLAVYYQYGVVATPSLALLDATGTIRYVRASYSTAAREEIREAVDGVLGISDEKAAKLALKVRDYVPPKKATLHYQKAEVLIQRGMGKKAIKDLEEAAGLDPKWPEPRVALARIYLGETRKQPEMLGKAEGLLREAREIRPKHVQTLAALADVLVRQGKYDEALAMAGEALAVEASYTPALLAKANSLIALKKVDEAKAVVEEALSLDPRNPEVLVAKGNASAGTGDWKGAAEALRRAVEIGLGRGAGGD